MAGELYKIIDWVNQTGNAGSFGRFKLRLLAVSLKEGIKMESVDSNTSCSEQLLVKARESASTVVGSSCPV